MHEAERPGALQAGDQIGERHQAGGMDGIVHGRDQTLPRGEVFYCSHERYDHVTDSLQRR